MIDKNKVTYKQSIVWINDYIYIKIICIKRGQEI